MSGRPVALVTGGARRVGRAVCGALCGGGCDLILTCRRSRDEAESARREFEAMGAAVHIEELDLDDLAEVEAFGARSVGIFGRLDVLVHNAAEYAPTPIGAVTAEEALRFYRVNAVAPLLLSKRLAGALAQSDLPGGGAIVAMADIHAMGLPRPGFVAYSMSKAALVEMVRALARELAPRVRVNGVAPGVVAWAEGEYEGNESAQRAYLSRVPLGRAGTPADAAGAVRWLALEAGYITGQIIRVDGGRSLR